MSDDAIFQTRLAAALGQYAELAPAMDDEAIARAAIETGRRTGRLDALRDALLVPAAQSRAVRAVYLIGLLALLLAAILAAVVGGFLRNETPPLPGRNGAIVLSVSSNNHQAATVATGPDGTGQHPIQAGRCPMHSRDGSALAWLSYDGSAADLVVASPDGSRPRTMRLVDSADQSVSYALSPDGAQVAWFRPVPRGPGDTPLPDASAATQGSGVELWVAPVDGGQGVAIASTSATPDESLESPLWSPDGRLIAFVSFVTDDASGAQLRTGIDIVAANGSDRRRLTTRPGLVGDGMSWSPDGRYLAYIGAANSSNAARPSGGSPSLDGVQQDLFVVAADGTGDRNLTETPAIEHDPEWSPDGGFLAFETSAEGVADRLTILRIDGTAQIGVPTLGPESDWFVWSPDGRELLWQELLALESETFRTTLHSIDREFRQPSSTLQVVDGLIVCPPSWQRLDQ